MTQKIKRRNDLNADALFSQVHSGFEKIPDYRSKNSTISLSDALMLAFAILMMLAFLVDQVQQLTCRLFQAVWGKLGSKRSLWEQMRALFFGYRFDSMEEIFRALFYGFKRERLIILENSSSS